MATILVFALLTPAAAQEAGLYQIERRVQVVVYPRRVEVRYEIGLSLPAAQAVLRARRPEAEVATDRYELIEQLRDLALAEIPGRLRIRVDDRGLSLRPLETRLFPKNSTQLECLFEAAYEAAAQPSQLTLVDGSFRGAGGAHLIALKGEDGVEVLSSTVPPILVRVPRQALAETTPEKMEAARRAEAQFRLAEQPGVGQPAAAARKDATRPPPAIRPPPATRPEPDRAPPPPPAGGRRWLYLLAVLLVVGGLAGYLARRVRRRA